VCVTYALRRATNLTDNAIVGISTYNVTPMKAGLYFHKIQCTVAVCDEWDCT
jgi:cytochrome c oxidase assembly protein Cox11